jgi:diadenylate cyclase
MSFLSELRWQDIVDLLVLSLALYVLLLWARQTRALRFAVIIVGLHACALWAMHFDLKITGWVLEGASLAVIGLLILLFQEEVRHSVVRFDSTVRLRLSKPSASNKACAAIGQAVFAMARGHIGALIVVTRKDPITDLVSGGVKVDAALSHELLEAIFESMR